jgi:hypothetical protein
MSKRGTLSRRLSGGPLEAPASITREGDRRQFGWKPVAVQSSHWKRMQ